MTITFVNLGLKFLKKKEIDGGEKMNPVVDATAANSVGFAKPVSRAES